MIPFQTQGHIDISGRFRRFVHVCVEECAIKAWIERPKRKYTRRQRGNEAKVVVDFQSESDGAGNAERPLTTSSSEVKRMAPADSSASLDLPKSGAL